MRTCHAVTGLGMVCALGDDVVSAWEAMQAGQPLQRTQVAVGGRDVALASVARDDASLVASLGLSAAQARRMNRSWLLALHACRQALRDAWGDAMPYARDQVGIFAATTLAGAEDLEALTREYLHSGQAGGLARMLNASYGALPDMLAAHFGLEGARVTVSTACSSSLLALASARMALLEGRVQAALVVGADALAETSIAGFSCLGAMTNGLSRPFSKGGVGITLGEGAAALVIEALGKTPHRRVYAYLAATAVESEAHHATAPDPSGRGAATAMHSVLAEAGVSPSTVGLVVAHGTGTDLNDASESGALRSVLGPASEAWVVSTKGATGHTLGAAGAINAVMGCMALARGRIPPSPAFQIARSECQIRVNDRSRDVAVQAVLVNAFGFAGSVASALLTRRPPVAPRGRRRRDDELFVTGLGVASHLGGEAALAQALCNATRRVAQQSPIVSYSGRRSTSWVGRVSLEDHEVRALLRQCADARRMDRTSALAYLAIRRLLGPAGVGYDGMPTRALGIFLGTQAGPLAVIEQFYNRVARVGLHAGNPSQFANTVLNACLGFVTAEQQIHGPGYLIIQNEVAASMTMVTAAQYLLDAQGTCEAAICGGVEEASDPHVRGFLDLGQTPSAGDLDARSLPFHPKGRGFYLAEGAFALMLERGEAMQRAGRRPRARYLGSTLSGRGVPGAWRYTTDGAAVHEAMQQACDAYGAPNLIVSNGCGYPPHDMEILAGLGAAGLDTVPHVAPAGVLGNVRGAFGGLGALAAVVALERQRVPALQPGFGLDALGEVSTVFVLSTAPGGYAVVTALGRTPPLTQPERPWPGV